MRLRDELQLVSQLLHGAARSESHHPLVLQISAELRLLLAKVRNDVCVALALEVKVTHTPTERRQLAFHFAQLVVEALLNGDIIGGGRLDGCQAVNGERESVRMV